VKHSVRMIACAWVVGLTLAALPVSANAGGLADGAYDCGGGYSFAHLGKVDIKGDQFRYRPNDEVAGGFAPYSVDANGMVHWGGPFGVFDDPPSRIVDSTREKFGFNLRYEASPGGSVNTMSCHAPGN
jgi:hypothetical protein